MKDKIIYYGMGNSSGGDYLYDLTYGEGFGCNPKNIHHIISGGGNGNFYGLSSGYGLAYGTGKDYGKGSGGGIEGWGSGRAHGSGCTSGYGEDDD